MEEILFNKWLTKLEVLGPQSLATSGLSLRETWSFGAMGFHFRASGSV